QGGLFLLNSVKELFSEDLMDIPRLKIIAQAGRFDKLMRDKTVIQLTGLGDTIVPGAREANPGPQQDCQARKVQRFSDQRTISIRPAQPGDGIVDDSHILADLDAEPIAQVHWHAARRQVLGNLTAGVNSLADSN